MPTTQTEPQAGVRPFPIARLDLSEEVRRMRMSPSGKFHMAKTLLHGSEMRLVLMTLQRGARIPLHHAEGPLTIQAIDGRVIVTLLESSFDLHAGQLLAVERDIPHALVAIEDSAILVTISWHRP